MKAEKRASTFLVVSTLGVCFLSVALIGVVSVVSVRHSARTDVTELADALLERAGDQVSFYLAQARTVAFQIYENGSVKALTEHVTALAEQERAEPHLTLSVQNYLDGIALVHDYIHSVVVATPTRIVASSTKEGFEPESYPTLFQVVDAFRPFIVMPQRRTHANGRQRNVLTLYYHGFGFQDAPADRYVFVSLDADLISIFLAGSLHEAIAVSDASGTILAASSGHLIGTRLPDTAEGSRAILSALSQSITIRSGEPFVRVASWREGRLRGVYVGEASVFTDATTALLLTIALSAIGAGAVATGLVLWLMGVLYRPISLVFDAGAQTIGAINPKANLKSIADRVISHLDELSTVGRQLLTVEETSFMRRLLLSSAPVSDGVVEAELTKAGLTEPGDSPVVQVVVLRLDGGARFVAGTTFNKLRSLYGSIRADADVIFHDTCRVQVVDLRDDELVVICFFNADSVDVTDGVYRGTRRFQEHINRTYQVTLTAAVSAPTDRLRDLRSAYHTAYDRTHYRLLFGPGLVITAAMVGERRTSAKCDEPIRSLMTGLSEATMRCESDLFQTRLDELLALLAEHVYLDIITVATEIAYSLSNLTIVDSRDATASQFRYVDLFDQLSMMESFAEIAEVIARIHHRIVQNLQSFRTPAADNMIHEGLEYIRDHQDDPQLSALTVAEHLGITPQYFSQVFHRATGKSFPQHLNDLRLQTAYELFRTNRRISVQDVCHEAGYRSRNHFANLFKAKYGLTPSQMRRRSLDLADVLSESNREEYQ